MSKSVQAQAAAMIRKHLKSINVSAKVKSDSASMMTAVRITLVDQPPSTVEAVREYCDQFKYGQYDTMQDIYNMDNTREDIPQVKYVSYDVSFSEGMRRAAYEYMDANFAHGAESFERVSWDHDSSNKLHRILTGVVGDFWATR